MKKIWHMFLRTILFPLGRMVAPCKIMNKDKYKKYARGQIIISNHLSWMDILYTYFGLPGYKRVLSKKENAGNWAQKAFMCSIGVIFIDRDKPELSSMRECIDSLKNGQVLAICPEGTRNKVNRELQPLHSGTALFALKGDAHVVPFVIHHKGKVFHRNYLAVGDPVDLSDLFGHRADSATIKEATERFRIAMQKTLDELDEWVADKGYKRERRNKRAERKKFKREYKVAKREYAENRNSK